MIYLAIVIPAQAGIQPIKVLREADNVMRLPRCAGIC
jgi:hypothetical protein